MGLPSVGVEVLKFAGGDAGILDKGADRMFLKPDHATEPVGRSCPLSINRYRVRVVTPSWPAASQVLSHAISSRIISFRPIAWNLAPSHPRLLTDLG